MSWKQEYLAAAGRFVSKHGTPRDMRDEMYLVYGWMADDWREVREHLGSHAPGEVTTSAFKDVEWSEFENTFTDNSEHHGVEITVTCACGEITDRVIRYEGTLGEILLGILTEDES
jgi:hypothetical protein